MIDVNKLRRRNELGKLKPELKLQYSETLDESILIELQKVTEEYNKLLFEIYSVDNIVNAFKLLDNIDHVIIDNVLIERTKNFIMFKDMSDERVIEYYNKKYNS